MSVSASRGAGAQIIVEFQRKLIRAPNGFPPDEDDGNDEKGVPRQATPPRSNLKGPLLLHVEHNLLLKNVPVLKKFVCCQSHPRFKCDFRPTLATGQANLVRFRLQLSGPHTVESAL